MTPVVFTFSETLLGFELERFVSSGRGEIHSSVIKYLLVVVLQAQLESDGLRTHKTPYTDNRKALELLLSVSPQSFLRKITIIIWRVCIALDSTRSKTQRVLQQLVGDLMVQVEQTKIHLKITRRHQQTYSEREEL